MALRIVDVPAAELSRHPDAMYSIFRGDLDVLIAREAFEPALMARVVQRISERMDELHWTAQQDPGLGRDQMLVMGQTLTPVQGAGFDLDAYFDVAERFRVECRSLFEPEIDVEAAIEALLGKMGGGRAVGIPADAAGSRFYTPATIRRLPDGHGIPVHCGNFFLGTPGYRHLAGLVDLEDQLSYFVTMRQAGVGGELRVHQLEWGDPATPMLENGIFDGSAIEATSPETTIHTGPGDFLVFDGGRYYHRVTPVTDGGPRWTLGGFASLSRDHERWYYWS